MELYLSKFNCYILLGGWDGFSCVKGWASLLLTSSGPGCMGQVGLVSYSRAAALAAWAGWASLLLTSSGPGCMGQVGIVCYSRAAALAAWGRLG